MYLLVKDIIERGLLEGAKLVAGKTGASNQVRWVIFMEILDALDSLQNGELLVTTGYQLDDVERHKDFIMRLKGRGVCAVAIQTGYYIETIPDYILEDADRYGLPVIELPASLTFSTIMHVIIDNLSAGGIRGNDARLAALKKSAVEMAAGIPEAGNREKGAADCLVLLSFSAFSNGSTQEEIRREADKLGACLLTKSSWCKSETSGDKSVALLTLNPAITPDDLTVSLMDAVTHISREDRVNVWAGCTMLEAPGDASAAFDRALSAYRAMVKAGAKKGACFYENTGMFRWLETMQKRDNSLSFAYEILKPLISYDSFHKSDFLNTLRVYLANGCRISETSEKLFIHRHTLKNRVDRISELCTADFGECYTRLHFSIAMLLYDYYLS